MAILPFMHLARVTELLEGRVPAASLPYCLQLWQEHAFHFSLRRSRISKLGDFSWKPGHPPHITVNADSHPYTFLLTYVHEVAHYRVHLQYGRRAAPHGQEWKDTFRNLCVPLLRQQIFPDDVAQALEAHLKNPKASSLSDPQLTVALHRHDIRMNNAVRLADIPEGSQFEIRGRWFMKGKLKRSRVLCREMSSRRQYLIAADAVIGKQP